MSRNKIHLVLSAPRDPNPHITQCGRNVLLGNIQYKLSQPGNPAKMEGVTCSWCRFGRER